MSHDEHAATQGDMRRKAGRVLHIRFDGELLTQIEELHEERVADSEEPVQLGATVRDLVRAGLRDRKRKR